MGNWKYECKGFLQVREILAKEIVAQEPYTEIVEHYKEILTALESCCDELTPESKADWVFYDAFKDLKEEIREEMELLGPDDYESGEETVNGLLGEMYELCDSASVWLGV